MCVQTTSYVEYKYLGKHAQEHRLILLSCRVSEVESGGGGVRGSVARPGYGPRGLLVPRQVESKLVVVYLTISVLITPENQ